MSVASEAIHQDQIKRSPTYWYLDGNLVLQAENTQFRVHQSLLGKDFPIFADGSVFSPESEKVEGCQVVNAAGDRAKDWENVLMTVYNPFTTYSSTMEYPIPVILSTLRLGNKYESDHLRDMAMTCLRTLIPCDPKDVQPARSLLGRSQRLAPPFVEYIFDILNIALELGIQTIVPTACLICIKFMGLEKILSGHTRSDGSISTLSPACCEMVILGWNSMLVEALQLTITDPMGHVFRTEYCQNNFLVEISPNDMDVFECGPQTRETEYALRIRRIAENPVRAFTIGAIQLCPPCAESINIDYYRGVDKLWGKLPSFYGMPKWDQMKDFY